MTLDEAIKHCEEKADELNKEVLNQANLCNAREMTECQECAREHEQLAEWLKDYKRLLGEKSYAMGYQDGLEDGLNDIRPQGEWLHNSDRPDNLICSVCNCGWDMWRYESKELKYCPNCGANMRSVDTGLQERAVSDLYTAIDDTYKKLGEQQ